MRPTFKLRPRTARGAVAMFISCLALTIGAGASAALPGHAAAGHGAQHAAHHKAAAGRTRSRHAAAHSKSARRAAAHAVPAALVAAAARRHAADHAFVGAARVLRACLRTQHAHKKHSCRASRKALQLAGHRFARAVRQLALQSHRNARGRAVGATARSRRRLVAPALAASGSELVWPKVRKIRSYMLQTQVPGEASQYTLVKALSTTPPPVPGQAVAYLVRTTIPGSHWSGRVTISYPGAAPEETSRKLNDVQSAPVLSASGQTLRWTGVSGVGTYIVGSRERGKTEQYQAVGATTETPAAVAGATIIYRVRTAVQGSAWSQEVSIAYPQEQKTKAPEEAPVSKEFTGAEIPTGLQIGIDSGTEAADLSAVKTLGAKSVRLEFEIQESPAKLEAAVAAYAAIGVRVLPLAGFYSRMPSAAEAKNLATWAKAVGPGGTFWAGRSDGSLAVRSIEFGNETDFSGQYSDGPGDASYSARAELYAVRLKEAAEAISASASNVGLLAQEDDQSGDWINGMYNAVPTLTRYVTGWTIHPYGGREYNAGRFKNLIKQTAEHGASAIPIDITEWGLTTDNGRCLSFNEGWNKCMPYGEAAEVLKSQFSWMKELLGSRLAMFMFYQVRDQRPSGATTDWQGYFGALQREDQPKGAYTTAVEELMQG